MIFVAGPPPSEPVPPSLFQWLFAVGVLVLLLRCFFGSLTRPSKPRGFRAIQDRFESLEEVQDALRHIGLESCELIVGIDFTKSNEWTGAESYGGRSLHAAGTRLLPNPYERVLEILGRVLEPFDDDRQIPVFAFGDVQTTNKSVRLLGDAVCTGTDEMLALYRRHAPTVQLSGPTSFAALIDEAGRLVARTKRFHLLVVLCDGQIDAASDLEKTQRALAAVSTLPLSVVIVGVGDGPFDEMRALDDSSFGGQRRFDNCQFVNATELLRRERVENMDAEFAVELLQELPEQFAFIKQHYLN